MTDAFCLTIRTVFFIAVFLRFSCLGSYAHDMGTNLSTLVNLSADNWAQHMSSAVTHSHHLPTAASMLTTSTGAMHHHQSQYHPASMWNLPATSPSCAMSQYLRGTAAGYHLPSTPETPSTGSNSSNSVTTVAVGSGIPTSSPTATGDLHHHHNHTTPPSMGAFPSTSLDSTSSLLTPHGSAHPHSLVPSDSVTFSSPIRDVKTAVGSWSPLTPPSL